MAADSPITALLRSHFPDWMPPEDRRVWNPCLCPFHAESRASASLSHELGAFRCHGCGVRGDLIGLIKLLEGVDYRAARSRAQEIADRSGQALPPGASRESGRRLFGQPRTARRGERGKPATGRPPWVRR
ncbi:hypothetical protein D5S17_09225 [Pseudonocardiaceae bacterium YIM PH 21723]|nr:hypothetical protein D5S17_09225 [Pseudonocardiaceae bacterium YIM PH 21723]